MENKHPIKSFLIYIFGIMSFSIVLDYVKTTTLNGILKIISYIILICIISKINKINIIKDLKRINKKSLLKDILIWFIGFIIFITINIIITKYFPMPQNEIIARKSLFNNIIEYILLLGVLAPILEEITFRYSFNIFKNKYLYITISSLIFALMHIGSLSEIIYILPYSILGIIFSLCYIKESNIFDSIFTHMLHNIIVLIIIILGV